MWFYYIDINILKLIKVILISYTTPKLFTKIWTRSLREHILFVYILMITIQVTTSFSIYMAFHKNLLFPWKFQYITHIYLYTERITVCIFNVKIKVIYCCFYTYNLKFNIMNKYLYTDDLIKIENQMVFFFYYYN